MKNKFIDWTDSRLEKEISTLQDQIKRWAEQHCLWIDCLFKDYIEHTGREPDHHSPVTLLISENYLAQAISGEIDGGYDESFYNFLEKLGYWHEKLDGTTFAIYPIDEMLSERFYSYFRWKWVCSLIKEDTADVYHELYEHFSNRPDDLNRLHWRDFEILLFRIFQNQGFEPELGPGRGDDGIDLRLWQRDPIGDILTLVQAKRYAIGNKIDLTQVAALYGISNVENANKALFVTTSSYQPVARRFSDRTSGFLELAERDDVVDWCSRATAGILQDKSSLISPDSVKALLNQISGRRDRRILHASYGYNVTMNIFALIVKESKHAALIMKIPSITISHDGYGQRGLEVPKVDGEIVFQIESENVLRAQRNVANGRVSYWDGYHYFREWDGAPKRFDYVD